MTDALIVDEKISCGMVLGGEDRQQVIDLARRAEAAGLDSIWVGDHISFYIPILESLTALAFTGCLFGTFRPCAS